MEPILQWEFDSAKLIWNAPSVHIAPGELWKVEFRNRNYFLFGPKRDYSLEKYLFVIPPCKLAFGFVVFYDIDTAKKWCDQCERSPKVFLQANVIKE